MKSETRSSSLAAKLGWAQKRAWPCIILSAAFVFFGLRFYAQFKPVEIYVSRVAPMPAELVSELHMAEHKIDPKVRIESPYDSAAEKVLSRDEVRRVRRSIAWNNILPVFIDSLTIVSPSNVVARHTTKVSMREYRLIKQRDQWVIESATSTRLRRYSQD